MKTTKAKSKDIVQEVQEEFEVRKIINEFEDEAIPDIHMALKKFMQQLVDIQRDYYHSYEIDSYEMKVRAKNKKPIDKFVAEFIKQLNEFSEQIEKFDASYQETYTYAFQQMMGFIESSYSKIISSLETINKSYIGSLRIGAIGFSRYEDFAEGHLLLENFLLQLLMFTRGHLETKDKILDVFQTITAYLNAKQNH